VKYIKLYEARRAAANSSHFSYSVNHSTYNVASADYYWDYNKCLHKAIQLLNDGHTSNLEIFKSGYHSTTQEEYLVKWWGLGHYWHNTAMKNAETGDFSLFKKYLYGIEEFFNERNTKILINRILSNPNSFTIFNKIKKNYPNLWHKFTEVNNEIDKASNMGGMGFDD
jgi:hypothetical protein